MGLDNALYTVRVNITGGIISRMGNEEDVLLDGCECPPRTLAFSGLGGGD